MIPQRRLTRTGFGNGVSCRVEACRRRLRSVRTSETQTRLEENNVASVFDSAGTALEESEMNFGDVGTLGRNEAEIT